MFTKLKLVKFIPSIIGKNRVNIASKENEEMIVSYKSNGNPKEVTFKKEIELNDFFFEIIGLYYGDGINSRKGTGKTQTGLANSNPELHNYWIQFCEALGTNRSELRAKISVGEYTNFDEKEVLNYWKSKTILSEANFIPTISIKKAINSKKQGLLLTAYNSRIFKDVFNRIFDFSLVLTRNNENFATPFLRGLFSAEGHIGKRKCGTLNYLEIPVKDKKRRKYVKSLFSLIGISPKNDWDRINIYSHNNFKTFNRLKLHTLHQDKKKKFEESFKLTKPKDGTRKKIVELLRNEKYLTRFQIADILNTGISGTHKILKSLEMKNIITKRGKTFSTNGRKLRDIWSLVK